MEKRYNLLTAIAMVVGTVIGSGVFFKAEVVLKNTGGNLMIGVLSWLIMGIVMIICTYTFGIVSSLVLGTGMCFAMQVLGSGMTGMVIGIIVGIIGMIGCGVNYPIYKKMLENGKKKYAYEIVELAREISESK